MKLSAHQYGKARVRVARVQREGARHTIHEADVQVMLSGDFASSYLGADNSKVVPTDTMKNTVNVLAQTELGDELERFGLALGRHFTGKYPQVEQCEVTLSGKVWRRIGEHSFTGNDASRLWVRVTTTREGAIVSGGVRDFLVLKTTESGFAGFPRCEFTTLPETEDRIFATMISATWDFGPNSYEFGYGAARDAAMTAMLRVFAENFSPSVQVTLFQMGEAVLAAVPEIVRVHFALPNKHYLLVNFAPFGRANANEVFTPTDEPHGQIEATIER